MKVFSTPAIGNFLKIGVISAGILVSAPHIKAVQNDSFEYSTEQTNITKDTIDLSEAPSPEVLVQGEIRKATLVVDISKNVLYQYDANGQAIAQYRVASGKPSMPTEAGLRIVTHVERYPYKSAPESTKRYNNPNDYGPRVICLKKIDSETGELSSTGQFIHGTNNPASIGKYVSKGCIRMNNDVIKEIAAYVQRGDLVLIKR